MKKRTLTLVLSLILIISMSVTAFGNISVKSDKSISAEDYTYTLMVTASDSNNGRLTYQWYECDSSGKNGSKISGETSNIFKPDKVKTERYYYCVVTSTRSVEVVKEPTDNLDPNDPNADPDANAQNPNNGSSNTTTQTVTETAASDIFKVTDATPPENTKILTFSVSDIDEPKLGSLPDTNGKIDTSSNEPGYSITSIAWKPNHNEFEAGRKYTVTVTVSLEDGYEAGNGFKCLINGEEAIPAGNPTSGSFTFSLEFSPLEEPDELASLDELQGENGSSPASPLGIPGWIGGIILIVILAAIIAAIILAVINRKKKKAALAEDPDDIPEMIPITPASENKTQRSGAIPPNGRSESMYKRPPENKNMYSRRNSERRNPFAYDEDKKTIQYGKVRDSSKQERKTSKSTSDRGTILPRSSSNRSRKNDNTYMKSSASKMNHENRANDRQERSRRPSDDGNNVSYYDPKEDE